jgi:hypothetical protein
MPPSDFEILLKVVAAKPNSTGRELASALRQSGHAKFTSKVTNQILYRLLSAQLVNRDGSTEKPTWSIGDTWVKPPQTNPQREIEKRPLSTNLLQLRTYSIAQTVVKVILDESQSPNDPYMSPDWVGSHVIAAVNCKHPFWQMRLTSDSDRSLYSMIVALDAYIQWKVARLNEPPDASEIQKMRDYALRFCSLVEAEQPSPD